MITSPKNPQIVGAAALKKRSARDGQRRFLVEGAAGLSEALATGTPLDVLFTIDGHHPLVATAREASIPVEVVTPDVMARLSSTVTPQGIVGIAPFLDVGLGSVLGEGSACFALLADCRDPGNAGAVVRSTLAVGGRGVVFCDDAVDVYNPKTVRASAGAVFHLPHVRQARTVEAVDALRAGGVEIVAASADGDGDLFEAPLGDRVAFLLGNEAWGLPDEVAALADRSVRIPLSGPAESLNLSAAATVCLFEWRRRRGIGMELPDMITAAAHDLRSPAAGVKSFAATLLSRELDAETRRMLLEGIAYDADRMSLVTQQLVDAARLASGTVEPFGEIGDVSLVVEELRDMLGANPDHPEIRWLGASRLEADFDRSRLRVALAACVELCVWHATEGPIEIMGAVEHGILRIRVTRDGCSLEAAGLEALFTPRLAGSGHGTKLGPYVARGVARSFGGDLEATMSEGRLRLVLSVPVAHVDQLRGSLPG